MMIDYDQNVHLQMDQHGVNICDKVQHRQNSYCQHLTLHHRDRPSCFFAEDGSYHLRK